MKIIIDCNDKSLWLGARQYRCAIGRLGVIDEKHGREGDAKTPRGRFQLRYGFYRPDRVSLPETALTMRRLQPDDGWCDAPGDRAYNLPVRLPYPASAERLWRDSPVYDVILVLSHNDSPPQPGLGSAVFLHIARNNYRPTLGCVAIAPADMYAILPKLVPQMDVEIS